MDVKTDALCVSSRLQKCGGGDPSGREQHPRWLWGSATAGVVAYSYVLSCTLPFFSELVSVYGADETGKDSGWQANQRQPTRTRVQSFIRTFLLWARAFCMLAWLVVRGVSWCVVCALHLTEQYGSCCATWGYL